MNTKEKQIAEMVYDLSQLKNNWSNPRYAAVHAVRVMLRSSATMQRINEERCNGVPPKREERLAKQEWSARAKVFGVAVGYDIKAEQIKVNDDPRGLPFIIVGTPLPATSFGGDGWTF